MRKLVPVSYQTVSGCPRVINTEELVHGSIYDFYRPSDEMPNGTKVWQSSKKTTDMENFMPWDVMKTRFSIDNPFGKYDVESVIFLEEYD